MTTGGLPGHRPPRDGGDPDGVRVTPRPRRGMRVLGVLALLGLVAFVGYRLLGPRAAEAQAATDEANATGGSVAEPARSSRVPGARSLTSTGTAAGAGVATVAARGALGVDGEDPTPDLSDYMRPGEAPTMGQVIEGLHRRGIRTGLGAFPPPGTSPPLQGLEVPEGFVLPEGYVRHHQATDDGQRISPILMFSPDLRFVEVRGRRVPVPADRLVTPELAPPGMALRLVRIPPPRAGSGGP